MVKLPTTILIDCSKGLEVSDILDYTDAPVMGELYRQAYNYLVTTKQYGLFEYVNMTSDIPGLDHTFFKEHPEVLESPHTYEGQLALNMLDEGMLDIYAAMVDALLPLVQSPVGLAALQQYRFERVTASNLMMLKRSEGSDPHV